MDFADLRLGNGVFDDCGSLEILALDGDREAKICKAACSCTTVPESGGSVDRRRDRDGRMV